MRPKRFNTDEFKKRAEFVVLFSVASVLVLGSIAGALGVALAAPLTAATLSIPGVLFPPEDSKTSTHPECSDLMTPGSKNLTAIRDSTLPKAVIAP